jgi:hypothetical protein
MNEFRPPQAVQARLHDQLVLELVREVRLQLELMRAAAAALEAQDVAAWRGTNTAAHNIAARADALRLGVLRSCARELERFSAAILDGKALDGKSLDGAAGADAGLVQRAMVAIETLELELQALGERSN